MWDIFHTPPPLGDIQVFNPNGSAGWQIWEKPRGKNFLYVSCIGGGGGGGGGGGNTAGATKGGGGGGGGASMGSAMFPMFLVPNRLYVRVQEGGQGGAGGTSGTGTTGGAGSIAYVSVLPDTNAANVLILNTVSVPTNATGGTTAAGGGAGTGGVITVINNSCLLCYWALRYTFTAGNAGQAGGTGASAARSLGTALQIYGGGAGAGTVAADTAAGGVSAIAGTPFSALPATAAGGNPGANGFAWNSLVRIGGQGGGGSNSTTGWRGGDGVAPGTGGGGGGGGATTGGRGGNGGPGQVILIAI